MSTGSGSPLVLAMCSATRTASVALLRGDEVVLSLNGDDGLHHAEGLLPLVDAALQEAGIEPTALDGYAISIGPGSFTSLRIGLATLKGLAFGGDIPAAPISTLQALAAAERGAPGRLLIALLDAQRDEVYAAAFHGAERGWAPVPEVLAERVYSAEELAARIPGDAILIGQGVEIVAATLRERVGGGLEIAAAGAIEPGAAEVGRLAAPLLARGEGVAVASLAPRYVRRAEAEVTRTAERFEPEVAPR